LHNNNLSPNNHDSLEDKTNCALQDLYRNRYFYLKKGKAFGHYLASLLFIEPEKRKNQRWQTTT